jgi:hypothetical protein
MLRITKIALATIAMIGLTACEPSKATGAKSETKATQQLMDQASVAVGMPGIRNFAEKRQLKMLYELRDNANLVTYSYFVDVAGNLHKICPGPSVGYGMPFSAQFTAPSVDTYSHNGATITTHQPEPNGLYMPDSTSATWVICQINGELKPVYVEPQIIVSLVPML